MTLTREDVRLVLEVAKEMGIAEKNDPASTTLTAGRLHGVLPGNQAQFGIFSAPGVRPNRFSTLVRPQSLSRILGVAKSNFWQELLEVFSGVLAASGTNATGWCGSPPTTPQGKVAQQVYKFGKFYGKTNLDALPEIGMRRNRADVPSEIMNAAPENRNPFIPDLMYRMARSDSQLSYELFTFGVALERSLESVLITGDNTQSSASTDWGWIAEFNGLDSQIKTGYTDIPSGYAVPAMDSAIITFNTLISSSIGGGDGRNFVQAMSDLVWALRDRATEMGMGGTTWGIVMRKEAFRAATENWACNYSTYRCTTGTAGQPVINDAVTMNDLRREMAQGQYLLVDNDPVPVIFSEGIPFTSQGGGLFISDMYVVPINWDGMPLLNLEYFPMDNGELTEFSNFVGTGEYATMNNGMYLVSDARTPFCKEFHFAFKPRLILETPWLAGRLDDVQYRFQAPIRSADPGNSFTYADGGVSYRT